MIFVGFKMKMKSRRKFSWKVRVVCASPSKERFFKTLFEGKNVAVMQESERGVNWILITILRFLPTSWKDTTFCLVAICSACREGHFQKKIVQNGSLFRFCKIDPRNTLFIFGREKMVVCCQTLSDFDLLFFKKKLSSSWERICLCEKCSMSGLGTVQPLGCSEFAELQRCNWANF